MVIVSTGAAPARRRVSFIRFVATHASMPSAPASAPAGAAGVVTPVSFEREDEATPKSKPSALSSGVLIATSFEREDEATSRRMPSALLVVAGMLVRSRSSKRKRMKSVRGGRAIAASEELAIALFSIQFYAHSLDSR